MVNLSPLIVNCIDRYRLIVQDKNNLVGNNRRDRLLALEATLVPRYDLYQQHFGLNTLEQIPRVAYSVQDRNDLLHCYTVETASLSRLITDIKENQLLYLRGICQFCGINTDNSTDHYLPKGSFPDFCVNTLNLLPCCSQCNSLKGEYLWDVAHNTRGIVNLYTDNIPFLQFLYANITYNADVPSISFSLQNNDGIDPRLYAIIERHYDRLDLLERYKDKFNSVYHQTYKSFRNKGRFANHPGRVRDFLADDAEQLFDDYGRNYYIGIIKDALANTDTFVNLF